MSDRCFERVDVDKNGFLDPVEVEVAVLYLYNMVRCLRPHPCLSGQHYLLLVLHKAYGNIDFWHADVNEACVFPRSGGARELMLRRAYDTLQVNKRMPGWEDPPTRIDIQASNLKSCMHFHYRAQCTNHSGLRTLAGISHSGGYGSF